MNPAEQYTDIIYRYLNGNAVKEDLTVLLGWLKESQENVKIFNQLCSLWEHKGQSLPFGKIETEIALKNLNRRIEEFTTVPNATISAEHQPYSVLFLKVAAVVLLLSALSIVLKYIVFTPRLVTSAPAVVTAYAPPSQKSQITLSDGTVVWLNSGTKIKYNGDYNVKTREIYLEGEAYFQVAKNPQKPFLVHASDITVKALGTSFNVKCYASDRTIETTLVEGRVEIENKAEKSGRVYLKPNEKAVFTRDRNEIQITRFVGSKPLEEIKNTNENPETKVVYEQKTVQSEISWKEQRLVFENEAFEDLVKRLERWYNINIRINDKALLKNRYTGKFVNDEPLEQVLKVIERTTPITYTIDKDNVTINSKH